MSTNREPYRFISYDSRDTNLVQFYLREVNNVPYIDFTYISPRDKRWADIIVANDIIFFLQDNIDVASAVIDAPYDSDHGFRLAGNPSPQLVEGQYYGIDYSRDRPEEDRDIPIENRGWSPLHAIQYLTFDNPGYSLSETRTNYFCFKLVDWLSGLGTKPPFGYVGTNGLVADVDNAAILQLPKGERGSRWTQGTEFPTSNLLPFDLHIFTEPVSSLTNYYQHDGTTAKTDAVKGEVAQWDGTKWTFSFIEVTAALDTVAFAPTLQLGNYENAAGAIAGRYKRTSDTRIDISHRNLANEDKSTEIEGIAAGQGIVFGDKIFVVEWTNEQSNHREFNGFWVNSEEDATAAGAAVSVKVIQHELRMIRFMTTKQLLEKLPIIATHTEQIAENKAKIERVDKQAGNAERVRNIQNNKESTVWAGSREEYNQRQPGHAINVNPRLEWFGYIPGDYPTPDYYAPVLTEPNDMASDGERMWITGKTTTPTSPAREYHSYLFTLDPITGLAERIRDNPSFGIEEFGPTGLEWHKGHLYAVGRYLNHLIRLNPETGHGELIGTATNFGVNQTAPRCLASDGDNLWMIGGTPHRLYRINTDTGVATPVGDEHFGRSWDRDQLFGIEFVNGVLYASSSGQAPALFTINLANAHATQVGDLFRFGAGVWQGRGLDLHNGRLYMISGGDPHVALFEVFPHKNDLPSINILDAEEDVSQKELADLQDVTSDIHLQKEVGDFADVTDAAVAGISQSPTSTQPDSIDYGSLTYTNPSILAPYDTPVYSVVRIAKSLGRIETQFRTYNEYAKSDNSMGTLRHEDANWYYYLAGVTHAGLRAGETVKLQRRPTHTHTRYDGELGDAALEQVKKVVPEGTGERDQDLVDRTSDLHVQDPVGDFANTNDATKQGISLIENNATNRPHVNNRTFDYTTLTWEVATVDIPDDSNPYWVVVRVAKSEGRIESQFQLISNDPEETDAWHLHRAAQEDANWYYYVVVEDEQYAWTLQRRTTHTHTRYDGELGEVALAQVDKKIPTGTGSGQLTDEQLAMLGRIIELLGTVPAAGDRDGKIAKFASDVLEWIIDPYPDELTALSERLGADEVKLEGFIKAVNNYFNGSGQGDVTHDQVAYLFALLDEYNPVIDEIRSTIGLVRETGEPRRLIQEYVNQKPIITHADAPEALPEFEYNFLELLSNSGVLEEYLIFIGGETGRLDIRANSFTLPHIEQLDDPYLRYYLNGDTDNADANTECGLIFVDNELFIILPRHTGAGSDPLAFLASSKLRPYATYAPFDEIPADPTNTTYLTEMTLAPTNADHDVTLIDSFEANIPQRNLLLTAQDARGWHFNDFASNTPNTICKILSRWLEDFAWIQRMYRNYNLLVEDIEQGGRLLPSGDPRVHTWADDSRDPNDVTKAVDRPPYPSFEALKEAIPLPKVYFYLKCSVSNFVMNIADHDIHNPKINKLVQIPDTHYNTPPRVTFLPKVARANELFQLVSDQYRPDTDHIWVFQPKKSTIDGKKVIGASLADVASGTYSAFGQTSDTDTSLPDIFQATGIGAFLVYNFDETHMHLHISTGLTTTSDVLVVEMHGIRSNGSPIVRTATFRHAGTTGSWRQFRAYVSGAYGVVDLSQMFAISIKRNNEYLYLNTDNNPATPEWETGLLYTAGLWKGKEDGSYAESVIVEKADLELLRATAQTYIEASAPDVALGVDHNKWIDSRNGKEYIKRAGAWTELIDFVLQSEYLPPDGKIIFGQSARPANNVGKIGDTYIRRTSDALLSLYEKTGAATWTYRYDLRVIPSYPSTGQRTGKGLFFSGDSLVWSVGPQPIIIYNKINSPLGTTRGSDNPVSLDGSNTFLNWRYIGMKTEAGTARLPGVSFRTGQKLDVSYESTRYAELQRHSDTQFTYTIHGSPQIDLHTIWGEP